MTSQTNPSATAEFALFVDQTISALDFMAGMQMAAAMLVAPTKPAPIYTPSPESIAATRRSMGRQGLAPLLTSRPKLSASERRNIEAKDNAARWGFIPGGGAA